MTEQEIRGLTASGVVEAWAKRHGISGSALDELRAEIAKVPSNVTVAVPPMPTSELIHILQGQLKEAHREIARMRGRHYGRPSWESEPLSADEAYLFAGLGDEDQ